MKKRILSLLLTFLMLFSMFPAHSTYAAETEKGVSVWYFDPVSEAMEEAGTVELYRGGELYLSVFCREDVSGSIQWQIEAGPDYWVDIRGGNAEDLRVSYGMVRSLLSGDSVRMRCAVLGDGQYYSDPFTVAVTDMDNRLAADSFQVRRTPVAPDPLPAPVGVANEPEETEPMVTEATEPVVTEPSEPAVTEPTEPAVTEPSEPAVTEPSEPAVTEPSEPAVTEPSGPAVTEPSGPAVTEPSEPAVTEPSEPAVTEQPASPADDPVLLSSSSSARIIWLSNVNVTRSGTQNEDLTYHTVTIEYVYGDGSKYAGQRVALPYIAEVASGETLNETVASPSCVGYLPDIASINLAELGEITDNVRHTVVYSPAEVSYTVRHYLQNVNNDDYTWVDTTMTTGYTEALTSDAAAKTYTGFTALSHYHEEIAADSSTIIDIYYDRNYYLMSFDLDGGHGVDPIFARYGASVSVEDPYKAGWDFTGWDKDIPSVMPAENKMYTASWRAQSGIPFTVAYWLEDANTDGKYNFWGSARLIGEAGTTVQGEDYKAYTAYLDTAAINAMDTYEKRYSYYDHADTDVVIKGDGSTVVNVYYNRNEYTLKFYYAARSGTGDAYTYKIFGGSTYFFGASNGGRYNGNELDLLNAIYTDGSYDHQWGQITAAPALNTLGAGRNYDTGADTKNGVDYLYLAFRAKYGADISAKWPCNVFESATRSSTGNNSGWSGSEAFVSAWNGEHHVYYSQHNGNQTIKGNYNELDYQLLWDYDKYGDSPDKTIAYLCFWENGSGDVNWNVPELYRYNIYVPVLTGQEPNQTDDGKYYLWATYDTCDNSTVGEQTAPAINGYSYTGQYTSTALHKSDSKQNIIYTQAASPVLFDEDGNLIYKEAYSVNFFYSRDQYKLTFINGDMTAQEGMVYFGADISAMAPTLTYYNANLADMYVFGGWYTSPDTLAGSEFDLTGAAMPASALTLYAKWNLITHNVAVYPTEKDAQNGTNQIGTTIAVTHDQPIPQDLHPDPSSLKHPEDETATFIGWFYKNENGEEQAYDFATIAVSQDMTIYAKWRSNVMKQVEICYVIEDENGGQVQIADTETLMLRLGQTRTFEAKTGSALYADYRVRCFPTVASHSVTPTDADLDSEDPLRYTFVYKQYGSVPYQVTFYVQELDGTVRPAFQVTDGAAEFVSTDAYAGWTDAQKQAFAASNTSLSSGSELTEGGQYIEQHWENSKAVVTELYIPDALSDPAWALPDEYLPSALKLQKIIIPDTSDPEGNITANTIQFIYTYTEPVVDPDNPAAPGNPVYKAKYLVQHYIPSFSDVTRYDLYSYSDEEGLSGTTASAAPIAIPGYTFSVSETDNRKQDGTTLDAENTMSGIITADDGLELNFYYTVNSYPYQVMYLEEGTNRVLSAAKTEVDGVQLSGLYGSRVTESAITINGYDVVGSSSKSIYIQMEADATASVNTIVFYYKRQSAELVLSKSVALDETQAEQEGISEIPSWVYDQEFVFTVYQPEGYPKSVYHYTFTDRDNQSEERTVNAGVQTIVVSLKHGQSIRFHDFPMGTYTVTETYVPGFRTSVDGYIAQEHTVTLDSHGTVGTLNFRNTFPFYTGDLIIKKNVTKLNESDPAATEPYKVTVVLNPDDSAREVDRVITFVDKDGNALTDADGNSSFTVPKLTGTDDRKQFTVTLLVPVGGEVKMENVPVGTFTATEEVKGTVGYIYDFYTVKYNKAVHENDEVTGTNHIVSGSIHGGHPTAVTFNNTYRKGDLVINKTVTQEYGKDNWQKDTFTFVITGTTELPDGTYAVDGAQVTVSGGVVTVKDAHGKDPAVSIVRTDDADFWSGSLTFENLPAGYYTVTEAAGLGNDRYTAVGPVDSLLVNDTATATAADFTNTYKRTTGSLQVGKEIVIVTAGSIIDTEQDFVFVVEPKDGTLTGSYVCTLMTTNGTEDTADDSTVENGATSLAVSNGKLTFRLKHNQYILIEGLPVGEYLVKEEALEGYDSSFGNVITNAGNYSVDPATITTDNTTVLNCQNAYPVYYSNLIVKKLVVTPADHSAIDQAPADDVFTFSVTIGGYSSKVDLTKGVTADFYDSTGSLVRTDAILLHADTLTFALKAGEWVDLNLPACTYTIAETGLSSTVNSDVLADHYTTDCTVGGDVCVAGESHTLVSGEQETVVFTNTYKRHYLDLTITTACADSSQSFVFDVSAEGTALGDIHLTAVLVGSDSRTIRDLPAGEYTVTERSGWSWRETSVDSQTIVLQTQSATAAFDFGTADRNVWLSGYSYRKKGGS